MTDNIKGLKSVGEAKEGGGGFNIIDFINAKVDPIDRSVVELWNAMEKARKHRCTKENTIDTIQNGLDNIRLEIGSWKLFKIIFVALGATILMLIIGAIISFSDFRVDINILKETANQQKEQTELLKSSLGELKENGRVVQSDQKETLKDIRNLINEVKKDLKNKKRK